MYAVFLTLTTIALGHAHGAQHQVKPIVPQILRNVFGQSSTQLENILVTPTTAATTYKDQNGESCKCLPHYLCDSKDNAVYLRNASVTGWDVLDIRFGSDECQESLEVCCKLAIPEDQVPTLPPPVDRGCGYRQPTGSDNVVVMGDGNEAQFGEFPWVVALLNADNNEYGGVGVLIHPQVVMTGAHIVNNIKRVLIRAGEWDTQTTKERLKSQDVFVDKVAVAPGFNPGNLFNDMALLHLQTPVILDRHINVACLPDQNEDFDYAKSCFANGWGKSVFGEKGRYAVILKKIEVNMVPIDTCQQSLRTTRLGQYFKLHESFVCAGGQAGKDTCKGDGGAPLVCPIGDNRYKLSGLVAWGINCGQEGIPGVYVRVSKFIDWVDGTMRSWGLPTDGYRI